MRFIRTNVVALLALFALAALPACGSEPAASQASSPWLLEKGPAETGTVQEALAAEPGQTVAVLGRVQDINRDGFAQFVLYDTSIPYCGEGEGEDCGCDTPWDYCCVDIDMQKKNRMPVELRGKDGRPLKGESLGLRLLDLVALEGILEHTESGSPILVVTKGWERKERPAFDDSIEFPGS